MENKYLEFIKTRRSCRFFKPEQISDEELQAVIEAGTYAPSGHSKYNCKIVAVRNPEYREELSKMNGKIFGVDSDPYYGAPTIVLVFAPEDSPNAVLDGSAIMENLLLGAHAIGLGACWINRERQMFSSQRGIEIMKEWGLPEGMIGIGGMALGYRTRPAGAPKPRREGLFKIID